MTFLDFIITAGVGLDDFSRSRAQYFYRPGILNINIPRTLDYCVGLVQPIRFRS